jgi:hypothetical protein
MPRLFGTASARIIINAPLLHGDVSSDYDGNSLISNKQVLTVLDGLSVSNNPIVIAQSAPVISLDSSVVRSNDVRLTDDRDPNPHGHDAAEITSGIIHIDRLPKSVFERLVSVTDQAARFALTSNDVQLGDTVKQVDTELLYLVVDESKLNTPNAAQAFQVYNAGMAAAVPWTGVQSPPDFSLNGHSHTAANITDFVSAVQSNIPVHTGEVTGGTSLTIANKALLDNGSGINITGGDPYVISTGLPIISVDSTVVRTDDIRLTDSRDPKAHYQAAASITDFTTEVNNIISSNALVSANTAKITNATHTGDVTGATALTIANKQTLTASNGINVSNSPIVIATSAPILSLTYGTIANTVCEGNDSRLSDARTPLTHNHSATSITSGVFDISRIPQTALARVYSVATESARLVLMSTTVQNGDTVEVTGNNKLYLVADDTKLSPDGIISADPDAFLEYVSSTKWSTVLEKPATFTPSSHSHSENGDISDGSIGIKVYSSNINGQLTSAQVANLSADNITFGTFQTFQIPNLDAGKISSGTFDSARIPSLDGSKITGTFTTTQIPDLDASKITTGTFATTRIPNLDASKITTGTINSDRLPALQVDSTNIVGQLTSAQITSLSTGQLLGTLTSDKIQNLNVSQLVGILTSNQVQNLNVSQLIGQITSTKIESLDSSKLIGQINVDQIPKIALNNLAIVPTSYTRLTYFNPGNLGFGLVQTGDSVKETDSGNMYLVIDDTKLNLAGGYQQYVAAADWSSISNKPATFSPSSHTHTQVADFTGIVFTTTNIPNLDASKVNTGNFSSTVNPDLIGATSSSVGIRGLVPAPTSADFTNNRVLGASGGWVNQSGGSLTVTQISGMNATVINSLTSTQIGYFNSTQLAGITAAQISAIPVSAFAGKTAAQMAAIPTTAIAGITSTQMNALATAALQGLSTAQLASLTKTQINSLSSIIENRRGSAVSSDYVNAGYNPNTSYKYPNIWGESQEMEINSAGNIGGFQVAPKDGAIRILHCTGGCSFTVTQHLQIPGFTTGQTYTTYTNEIVTVHALSTTVSILEINGSPSKPLTAAQISGMSSSVINSLTSTQIGYFNSAQIAGITSAQMAAIPASAFAGRTATQLAAIPTAAISGITTAQIASLTTTQINAIPNLVKSTSGFTNSGKLVVVDSPSDKTVKQADTNVNLSSALNFTMTSLPAAATTNIWASLSNLINLTGTTSITAFDNAPQAGAIRVLYCAAACQFTNNASLSIQGNANYTASVGDIVTVYALTTTTFKLVVNKASSIGGGNPMLGAVLGGMVF